MFKGLKKLSKEMSVKSCQDAFLKKLDFEVTFILINETFNLKRIFTFKKRQNKSSYIILVLLIVLHVAAIVRIAVSPPGI